MDDATTADDAAHAPPAQALSAWDGLELGEPLHDGRPQHGGRRATAHHGQLRGRPVVVRRSARSPAALAWQLDLVADAAAAGVGVPRQVTADDGRREVDGVTVEQFVRGRPPRWPQDGRAVRDAVRLLHEATAGRQQRPGFRSSTVLQRERSGGDVDLSDVADELVQALRGVWRALPPTDEVAVHGDLGHHNVLITPDDRVVLLDFDACRVDLPWFDLAALPPSVTRHEADPRLVRAAGLAWEVAAGWTVAPGHARRRLAELQAHLADPATPAAPSNLDAMLRGPQDDTTSDDPPDGTPDDVHDDA